MVNQMKRLVSDTSYISFICRLLKKYGKIDDMYFSCFPQESESEIEELDNLHLLFEMVSGYFEAKGLRFEDEHHENSYYIEFGGMVIKLFCKSEAIIKCIYIYGAENAGMLAKDRKDIDIARFEEIMEYYS